MLLNLRVLHVLFPAIAIGAIGMAKSYENVEFARADGNSLQMDASVPEGRGPFPAVIIVHGGAWVTGDRRRSVEPLFKPLSDANVAWFSISYRLANGLELGSVQSAISSAASLVGAVDDVRQSIAYVRKHASEYGVDPNRMAIIGESAGAQLASMAALKPGPEGSVKAVVAFYSPSDLVRLIETNQRIPASIRQTIQGTPFGALLMAGLRDQSPINLVQKDSPPFLLIHGTNDGLVPFDQSQQMCAALTKAGASCELYPVEGGGHGMRWWESQSNLTGYKQRMIRWLSDKLSDKLGDPKP